MKLTDAQEKHRQHPETFYAPSLDEIGGLRVDDLVKLYFDDFERMWVKIIHVNGNSFEGTLANSPVCVRLRFGDTINFQARHIYDYAEDPKKENFLMNTKIHNLRQYSPAEIEAFRQRMEAEHNRDEEYRETEGGMRLMANAVIAFVVVMAIVLGIVIHYWRLSDALVGLK